MKFRANVGLFSLTTVVVCISVHIIRIDGAETATPNLKELAQSLNLTNFELLLKRVGMEGILNSTDNYTIFAPTDDAFIALPLDVRQRLVFDKELAKNVLSFHLTSGWLYSSSWNNDEVIETGYTGSKNRINIYKEQKNVIRTLTGRTINEKFIDQNATNGIINILDSVIWPIPSQNALDAIKSSANLTMFSDALNLNRVGLKDELKTGTWTVFAPTDTAFKKFPDFKLKWMTPPLGRSALKKLLEFHMIKTTLFSAGLQNNSTLTTANGKNMTVYVEEGVYKVSNGTANATLVHTNDAVTNGVIHWIDTPFVPKK